MIFVLLFISFFVLFLLSFHIFFKMPINAISPILTPFEYYFIYFFFTMQVGTVETRYQKPEESRDIPLAERKVFSS